MKRLERIGSIRELLKEKGNLSTVYLARTLNVSESSIRRDLKMLAADNLSPDVERVHGGILMKKETEGLEHMFEVKMGLKAPEKKAIAGKASEYIADGDSIIIDSGTTCLFLARSLHAKKSIHVLVLDVKIAQELGKYGHIESSILGGVIRPGYYTLGGNLALVNLAQFRVDTVFLSADAVDPDGGIMNISEFEVGVKRALIDAGRRIILLADSSKFERKGLYRVSDLSRIHTIVTDSGLPDRTAERLRGMGTELVVV